MFYNNTPKLDLHGQDRITAKILTEEFINDNYKLHNTKGVIIHGIGTGIIRKTVHNILKRNPLIEKYKIDIFNAGTTLIDIKKQ